MFRSLGDWDATWYRWIAQNGYDPSIGHGNTAAFFPLFPLLWRPLTWLPGPVTMWGSLLSSALLLAALCLLYRMTEGRFDEGMARRTVLYLAIFPLTFVFSLPYAESLFLLLVLGGVRADVARALVVGLRCRRRRGDRAADGDRAAPGARMAALAARASGGRRATCRCS